MVNVLEQVKLHRHLYYEKDAPIISDAAFDMLEQQLTPQAREILGVGGKPKAGLTKVAHKKPMLSLDKTYNANDLGYWIGETNENSFSVEAKVDGLAVSLIYKHGELVSASTRGNGFVGEDVTANVKTISSIPKHLPDTFNENVEIRGEVYMSLASFNAINADRASKGKSPLKNQRNAAAGSLRVKNAAITANRLLDFVAYYLMEDSKVKTQSDALAKLSSAFMTPKSLTASRLDVMQRVNDLKKLLPELDYPSDGIVIKVNELKRWRSLGENANTPRWAIAFKFREQEVRTRIVAVNWHVGKTGRRTPVADIEPVELGGCLIKRVNLHSEKTIERLGVMLGDYVTIKRRAEVVPEIASVDLQARTGQEREIKFECSGEQVASQEVLEPKKSAAVAVEEKQEPVTKTTKDSSGSKAGEKKVLKIFVPINRSAKYFKAKIISDGMPLYMLMEFADKKRWRHRTLVAQMFKPSNQITSKSKELLCGQTTIDSLTEARRLAFMAWMACNSCLKKLPSAHNSSS